MERGVKQPHSNGSRKSTERKLDTFQRSWR